MEDMYLTDLTPAEEVAGFKLIEIENPYGHYAGHPKTIRAIVYRFGKCYRLVKLRHPSRPGHYYNLEMYAVFKLDPPHVPPTWVPIRADYWTPDPNQVSEDLGRWIRDNPTLHYLPRDPEETDTKE